MLHTSAPDLRPHPIPAHHNIPPEPADDGVAFQFIDTILQRQDELIEVLGTIATRSAVLDEIRRSIAALAGARWEIQRHRPRRISELAVFLPSNNVLYSYVLFAIIPLLYSERVAVRPSSRVIEASSEIHRILTAGRQLSGRRVDFMAVSQRSFMETCGGADAVVFNGQPSNAFEVGSRVSKDSLFLSFGSGPNPFVIGPQANLAAAVSDLTDIRFYNSGQDCLCPDIAFVHSSVADEVRERLIARMSALRIGERSDPDVDIAPLVYGDAVADSAVLIEAHRSSVVFGGQVDIAEALVHPTIIDLNWDSSFHPPEFFSPVLCLMSYDHPGQIHDWLHSAEEMPRGMYLSSYGEPAFASHRIASTLVLDNVTTLDAEDGNQPLGGYGVEASHRRLGDKIVARPLLLSAELGRRGAATPGPEHDPALSTEER